MEEGRNVDVSIFGTGTLTTILILTESSFSLTVDNMSSIESMLVHLLYGGAQRKPNISKSTRNYLLEQMMIRYRAFRIIGRVFKSHSTV